MDTPNLTPKISLDLSTEIKCECGCNTFTEAVMLRKFSKIATGTDKDALIPIPAFICSGCGSVLQELLPKELRNEPRIKV